MVHSDTTYGDWNDRYSDTVINDYHIMLDSLSVALYKNKYPSSFELDKHLRRNNIYTAGIVYDSIEFIYPYLRDCNLSDIYFIYLLGQPSTKFSIVVADDLKSKNMLHGFKLTPSIHGYFLSEGSLGSKFLTYCSNNSLSLFISFDEDVDKIYNTDIREIERLIKTWQSIPFVFSHIGYYASRVRVDEEGSRVYWSKRSPIVMEILRMTSQYHNVYSEISSLHDVNKCKILADFIKRYPSILTKILNGSGWPLLDHDIQTNMKTLENNGIPKDYSNIILSNVIYEF